MPATMDEHASPLEPRSPWAQGEAAWHRKSLAAKIPASALDLRKDRVRDAFASFRNAEHRLERVAVHRGIEWVNDSKATNVNSTWYALQCMDRPVILVMGGIDKGNDYTALKPLVAGKVKAIVVLGHDRLRIHKAFGNIVDMIANVDTMDEAVRIAAQIGRKGDCVLLSPACASFDLFEDYQDRGRQFKSAVKSLQ